MRPRMSKILILMLGVILLNTQFTQSISAVNSDLTGQKICIDPGHGGSDPGATNIEYDLSESMINLDVSYALKYLLEDCGAAVVLTRTDDSYKDNNDRYTFCNNEEATILLSVHTNSVIDPTWDGSMALYFHPDDDDQILARSIYDVMYPLLKASAPDPSNFTSFDLDWFASGVLLKSDMPAAMLEPLFMSNPAEAALLVQFIFDDPYLGITNTGCANLICRRGEIARSIHQGVLSYIETSTSGSMHVSSIDMSFDKKMRNYFVISQVAIQDDSGYYVPDAEVSVSIIKPDGTTVSISDSSGIDGSVTFKIRSDQVGTFETTVTAVSKDGWTYNEEANTETSDFLLIP
jgi:N-acetylmuramoyl-L-alanine amidase